MYPNKAQKQLHVHAMNSDKKIKQRQFLYNLILHSLTALTCSFLCSHSHLFPSSSSSLKHFLFISLPQICSSIFNPKCLFIVVNVIVVFLVGESKISTTTNVNSSSPANEFYKEYVERSRVISQRRRVISASTPQVKKVVVDEKRVIRVIEAKQVKEEMKRGGYDDDDDDDHGEKKERDHEEEEGTGGGLPAEELNKRVEEFIARVNKQRWLEDRLLVCRN